MVHVDPTALVYAAIGGALLGISTSLHYALRGKITGMSGLLYSLISINRKELPEKLNILGGMLLISGIFFAIYGYSTHSDPQSPIPFGSKSQIVHGLSYLGFIVSGFLVGFGTKLSNGCTSGHGLCGLPRFSIRSFVAVSVFLVTGIVVATLKSKYGLPFITSNSYTAAFAINHQTSAFICLALGAILPMISYYLAYVDQNKEFLEYVIPQNISFGVGILFGLGLLVSGMTRRAKISAFLTFDSDWDPSLLVVLGVGVTINLIVFNYMIHVKKISFLGDPIANPQSSQIDQKLVGGAFCFGLGWGIGSLCPGPFLMLLSVFSIEIHIFWGLACFVGMFVANKVAELSQPAAASEARKI